LLRQSYKVGQKTLFAPKNPWELVFWLKPKLCFVLWGKDYNNTGDKGIFILLQIYDFVFSSPRLCCAVLSSLT